MKKISKEHEWVEVKDGVATLGITSHAADELGDITFVELPEKGQSLGQAEQLGVVESVKAASDIYAPVAGTVAEVNEALEDEPEIINRAAESDGWICKLSDIDESGLDSLMTEDEYRDFLGE